MNKKIPFTLLKEEMILLVAVKRYQEPSPLALLQLMVEETCNTETIYTITKRVIACCSKEKPQLSLQIINTLLKSKDLLL